MDREKIRKLIDDFTETSPLNHLGAAGNVLDDNYAKNNLYTDKITAEMLSEGLGELKGMRFYQKGLFSIVRADDPGFAKLKEPGIVGDWQFMPEDWLPGAKTVISLFLPFERDIVESNAKDRNKPSKKWMHARVDGQRFLLALGTEIKNAFIEEGYKAITPYTEDNMIMKVGRHPMPGTEHIPEYNSNWSERHVGYVAGLGTFGLSTNFISKAGCAGRLLSVITDWKTWSDEKDYDDWLGYCNQCGACKKKCPADAFYQNLHGDKDKKRCGDYVIIASADFAPRFGCGKCECGLPCSFKPMRPKK